MLFLYFIYWNPFNRIILMLAKRSASVNATGFALSVKHLISLIPATFRISTLTSWLPPGTPLTPPSPKTLRPPAHLASRTSGFVRPLDPADRAPSRSGLESCFRDVRRRLRPAQVPRPAAAYQAPMPNAVINTARSKEGPRR